MQLCEICSGVFLWFRKNTVGNKNFPPKTCLRALNSLRELKIIQENCKELCEVEGVSDCVILHKYSQQ